MSFINWGHETPEQKAFRRKLEEQALIQNAMAKKIFEARGANSAATSASAASAGAAGGGGGGTVAELSLTLEFSSVAGAQAYVANLSDVSAWNTFFDLPSQGNPFTRVEVDEATISLYGGSGITMRTQLFTGVNAALISVDDQTGCITGLNNYVFGKSKSISQTNLVSVNLPAVETASVECFRGCSSLTSVNMPVLTTAGANCFQNCISLTSISLPALMTAGDVCFNDCTSLTSLSLPALTTAGNSCFFGCSSLTSVYMPALTTADAYCFQSCSSLATISLPSLTTAVANLFQYCTSLTSVSIPSCTNLGGTVGNNNIFFGISGKTIQLTVPAALMTNNGGNPDGDIQYLQANNTVTITQE